jgi:glycerophosphoryl diester phosphodiesterase
MLHCLLALSAAFLISMPTLDAKILVHGHRGARAVMPENTIPAFEHAISVGADVLELDVVVTKDSIPVVSHDPVLNPKICKGPAGTRVVREMTLDELRQWDCGGKVPTLDEVLSLSPKGRFEFNVETKIRADQPHLAPPPDEFVRLVLDVIRKHKLESRVILQSFDFRTLQAIKRMAPEIRRSALYEAGGRSFVSIAGQAEAGIVSPHYSLVTAPKVKAAHDAGLQVVPWTANTSEDWDGLIEAKVDAIITDDPAALIKHLRARGLRQ